MRVTKEQVKELYESAKAWRDQFVADRGDPIDAYSNLLNAVAKIEKSNEPKRILFCLTHHTETPMQSWCGEAFKADSPERRCEIKPFVEGNA